MTLRQSEAIFRILVGIALAIGFVGFVTHSHVTRHHASKLNAPELSAPALMVSSAPTPAPVGVPVGL